MSRPVLPLRFLLLAALFTAAWTAASGGVAAGAILTVDTGADADAADGSCSLREAILAANADAAQDVCPAGNGEDHVVFDLSLPATIVLTDHLPAITESLAIHGPGPNQLTLDGDGLYRAITIEFPSSDVALFVERLTLADGRTEVGDFGGGGASIDGGASARFERVGFIGNHSENSGGGMMVGSGTGNESHVTLVECLFAGNVAEGPAGGGGLATTGTGSVVEIHRSTFAGNQASAGAGGGLSTSRGFITVEASTISGNVAQSSGGGIYSSTAPQGGASLVFHDSTITGNTAGDGLSTGDGGGLYLSPGLDHPLVVSIRNTVVAGNVDLVGSQRPDVFCSANFAGVTTTGSNLIGANDGCSTSFPAGSPNADGDLVGTVAAPIDPGLEALTDNGGPTPTHRPRASPPSPLVDQGSCSGALSDQRRRGDQATGLRAVDVPSVADAPGGDGCDIGAVEVLADPMFVGAIFADGFETGNKLRWSGEEP